MWGNIQASAGAFDSCLAITQGGIRFGLCLSAYLHFETLRIDRQTGVTGIDTVVEAVEHLLAGPAMIDNMVHPEQPKMMADSGLR
jgi:hypothetical protein